MTSDDEYDLETSLLPAYQSLGLSLSFVDDPMIDGKEEGDLAEHFICLDDSESEDDEREGEQARVKSLPFKLRFQLSYLTYGPSFLATAGSVAGWLACWHRLLFTSYVDVNGQDFYPYVHSCFLVFLLIQSAAVFFLRSHKAFLRTINYLGPEIKTQPQNIAINNSDLPHRTKANPACLPIRKFSALLYCLSNPLFLAFEVMLNCGANFELLNSGFKHLVNPNFVGSILAGVVSLLLLPAAIGGISIFIFDTSKNLNIRGNSVVQLSQHSFDEYEDVRQVPVAVIPKRVKVMAALILFITLIAATYNDYVTMVQIYIFDVEEAIQSRILMICTYVGIGIGLLATFHVKMVNSYYRLEKFLFASWFGRPSAAKKAQVNPNLEPFVESIYASIVVCSEYTVAVSNLLRTLLNMWMLFLQLLDLNSDGRSTPWASVTSGCIALFFASCSCVNILASFKIFPNKGEHTRGVSNNPFPLLGYVPDTKRIVVVQTRPLS